MVILSPSSLFDIIIIVVVVSVLLFGLLLVLRRVCASEKLIKWFANLKIRHILFGLTSASLLVFIVTISKLMIDVRLNTSTLILRLETCNRLSLYNSYVDRDILKFKTERVIIIDREKIQKVVNLMSKAKYRTPNLFGRGIVDSKNYLDIHTIDIGETGWYRVIEGYLVKSEDCAEPWCYECTDERLLDKLRQALGLKGDYLYLGRDSKK